MAGLAIDAVGSLLGGSVGTGSWRSSGRLRHLVAHSLSVWLVSHN